MSVCDYSQEFWTEIESDFGGTVPEILKKILANSGYEIRVCLENLTANDIDTIEQHAKIQLKDKLKRWMKEAAGYENMNLNDFAFLPGHRKVLALFPARMCKAAVKSLPDNSENLQLFATATNQWIETNDNEYVEPSQTYVRNDNENVDIGSDSDSEEKGRLTRILVANVRLWMKNKKFDNLVSAYMEYVNTRMT